MTAVRVALPSALAGVGPGLLVSLVIAAAAAFLALPRSPSLSLEDAGYDVV
jgi:hypothetical protein